MQLLKLTFPVYVIRKSSYLRLQHMPQLEYITKGLRKLTLRGSTSAHLPITPHIMRLLLSIWKSHPSHFNVAMLWAASCMCFFGFLRSGEVVVSSDSQYNPSIHLSNRDVRVNDTGTPEFLEVHIKASKTDPFHQGVRVYLGKSGSDNCPLQRSWRTSFFAGGSQAPSSFLLTVNL